jgi:glycosidase
MNPQDEMTLFSGFHVSGDARNHYQFERALFAQTGKAAIHSFYAARSFAQQMNLKRDLASFPEQAVRASEINAMALIHGIMQFVFRTYCQQINPNLLKEAIDAMMESLGPTAIENALDFFVSEFPAMQLYLGETDRKKFLSDPQNREWALEEIVMLWLSNSNPAFSPYLELFSDDNLDHQTAYHKLVDALYKYFGTLAQEDMGQQRTIPTGENIIDFLLAPSRAVPYSLDGQLSFILARWANVLGAYVYRLLRAMDLIREEHKPSFGPGGPGPVPVPYYGGAGEPEFERFTADRDWMPNLVLIAKNAYVWLDQMSKKYQRAITRLDQIPDEELDSLQAWGFTGLWLIGLWERSSASARIKHLCGNPDAVASAYSLFEYRIADALGGEDACNNLRERAWKHGIRLASDMVPNHVGIDGKWVIEHPDWFVSLDYSPFPGYSFNGPDLSWDGRVGLYLEDHYYSRTDAAVVFKRVDRWTGSEKYIYHGNDGTSMPWNDTAQLNYLNPEVREAMIQLILHIARQFPIIRFDAAMTLVKRHFQRLWFPEPGSGGDIPSRAEHGLTKAQFDSVMPQEFWREVVDRAAVEAPDTLLLAEAFWLMEGYFVRTLGMHRVYNSAFMNVLRDEDNSKYRLIMKNTLEFDPEILRRYVNFMNNPDERTAVEQFGKEDKYFGICTLMVTMPGLPMFGHGQLEGFTEKYGMEYRRAYWDEQPDMHLIQRHEREIFPLSQKRYLFAGVEHFLLYDFYRTDGNIDENVFAYSNRANGECSLVVYHNVFGSAHGWIRTSVGFSVKTGNGDERIVIQRSLADGLALRPDGEQYVIFRDFRAGLEYIRNCKEIYDRGLFVDLNAYQCYVFLDFRVVTDNAAHQYGQLAAYLGGRGVPNIEEALQEIFVQPIREPFKMLVNGTIFQTLLDARITTKGEQIESKSLDEIDAQVKTLLTAIVDFNNGEFLNGARESKESIEKTITAITKSIRSRLENALGLLVNLPEANPTAPTIEIADLEEDLVFWGGLFGWIFVHALGDLTGKVHGAERSRSWIDEWLLGRILNSALNEIEVNGQDATQILAGIRLMTLYRDLFDGSPVERADRILAIFLADADAQELMRINRYQNILWFDKAGFERLLRWLLFVPMTRTSAEPQTVQVRQKTVAQLAAARVASGYQVEKLRSAIALRTQTPV